ncbi:hypothetical protein KGF57_003332 [Candida theae]|uniref:Peptidase A1 domain-containing protein n=1 Tax=Candida theae TaxID=1198502 RepID=A0AAD5FYA9_9ASCO|nr:uncharacterized protein KGF57_003332 [Candida theae]KAI5957638.1 hypothetical protein KGF57_003332 [Candida theae]
MVIITTIQFVLMTTLYMLQCQGAVVPTNSNKVLPMDFEVTYRDYNDNDVAKFKRDYIKADLKHRKSFYTTQIKFGPKQNNVKAVIDTGSSDLWWWWGRGVAKKNGIGEGVYSVEKSKTASRLNTSFEIEYPDGTIASGKYVQDSIYFGNKRSIYKQQFAVVNKTSAPMGVLGVGVGFGEATAAANSNYDGFVYNLKNQGIIGKAAYSIYLPEKKRKSGTILFGGEMMRSKYSGNLTTYSVTSNKLSVPLKSVSLHDKEFQNDTDTYINSGSRYSYLPTSIVQGKKHSEIQSFNFANDTTIQTPVSYFVYRLKNIKNRVPDHAKNHCGLSIFPTTDNAYGNTILGDDFLKCAYLSVNLEKKTVGLAQVVHSKHHSYQSL